MCIRDSLRAIERVAIGNALTVPTLAVTVHHHNDELSIMYSSETSFEELDERQSDEPQLDAVDFHKSIIHRAAVGR